MFYSVIVWMVIDWELLIGLRYCMCVVFVFSYIMCIDFFVCVLFCNLVLVFCISFSSHFFSPYLGVVLLLVFLFLNVLIFLFFSPFLPPVLNYLLLVLLFLFFIFIVFLVVRFRSYFFFSFFFLSDIPLSFSSCSITLLYYVCVFLFCTVVAFPSPSSSFSSISTWSQSQ